MAGKHDVYVFEDRKLYVRPAVAFGIAGRPLRFRNLIQRTLNLTFPPGLMKEDPPYAIESEKSKTYHVRSTANGLYSYSAWSRRRGKTKKAIGESDPRIIIDF
jgi:hypothetical protein